MEREREERLQGPSKGLSPPPHAVVRQTYSRYVGPLRGGSSKYKNSKSCIPF